MYIYTFQNLKLRFEVIVLDLPNLKYNYCYNNINAYFVQAKTDI